MKSLILSVVLLATLPAFAGIRNVGNGGLGVFDDNKLYVLDLVEAGIHKSPYFDPKIVASPEDVRWVQDHIRFLDVASAQLLARKLLEIEQRDPVLGHILKATIKMFVWKIQIRSLSRRAQILELEMQSVPPRYKSVALIAERWARRIGFDWYFWARLAPPQRVALIIHEVVYALTPVYEDSEGDELARQISRVDLVKRARATVAQFFAGPYEKSKIDRLGVFPPRPSPSSSLATAFASVGPYDSVVSFSLENKRGSYLLAMRNYADGPEIKSWYIRLLWTVD